MLPVLGILMVVGAIGAGTYSEAKPKPLVYHAREAEPMGLVYEDDLKPEVIEPPAPVRVEEAAPAEQAPSVLQHPRVKEVLEEQRRIYRFYGPLDAEGEPAKAPDAET